MTHKELEAMVEKYQAKADEAYYKHQETGMSRYYTSYINNSEMAEALMIALNAKDEHDELRNYRCTVSIIAQQARSDSKRDGAIKNLIAFAESQALIPKEQKGVYNDSSNNPDNCRFEAFTEAVKKTTETVKELGRVLEEVKKSEENEKTEFREFVRQKVR